MSGLTRRAALATIGGLLAALGRRPATAQYSYEDAIRQQCAIKGCDADFVIQTMLCESGGDPNAVSAVPNKYAGGYDIGLFQVNENTWPEIAYAGADVQIDFATTMFSTPNGWTHWTCAGGVS